MKKLAVLALGLALSLIPSAADATFTYSYFYKGVPTTTVTIDIPDFVFPAYGGCHDVVGTIEVKSVYGNEDEYTLTGNIVGPNGQAEDYVLEWVDDNSSKTFEVFMCQNSVQMGTYTLHGKVERENYEYNYKSSFNFTETFTVSKPGRARIAKPWTTKKCKRLVRQHAKALRKHQFAKAKRIRVRGNALGCAE